MSLPPTEIPLGAIRFNSDSQKLEYWMGSAWMQIHTFSPNLDGGARGLIGARYSNAYQNRVDFITIPTQGNGTDFGDDTNGFYGQGGGSSNTRAIYAGGSNPSTGQSNEMRFATFSSTGNFADFGDLTVGRRGCGGVSSQTRFVIGGGYDGSNTRDIIDFVTIASTGNAVDFGDTVAATYNLGGVNSPTRGVFCNGSSPSGDNVLQFITIASTGNAQDFGDTPTLKVNDPLAFHTHDNSALCR